MYNTEVSKLTTVVSPIVAVRIDGKQAITTMPDSIETKHYRLRHQQQNYSIKFRLFVKIAVGMNTSLAQRQ